MGRVGRSRLTISLWILPTRKPSVAGNCANGVPTAELRGEGTEVFFTSPTKGAQGGIGAGKTQLTRIKPRERGREVSFVLDGEVVNRCKKHKQRNFVERDRPFCPVTIWAKSHELAKKTQYVKSHIYQAPRQRGQFGKRCVPGPS